MCVLCKKDEETNDHLFTTYNYTQVCWYWLMAQSGWLGAIIPNLKDWLRNWPLLKKNSIFHNLWICSPTIVIWEVWKERNRRIFQDTEMKTKILIAKIEASIIETSNNRNMNIPQYDKTFTEWDNYIRKM